MNHLLIGSALDNFVGSNIFDATRKLADLMAATPGTSLFVHSTGHSVHFERPRYLANEIVDFLPAKSAALKPTQVLSLEISCVQREDRGSRRILGVGGTDHTRNVPFSLTVEECVDFIDFGCDVFVARAGSRTDVHVVRKPGRRPYLATDPDAAGENNLLSLPVCDG